MSVRTILWALTVSMILSAGVTALRVAYSVNGPAEWSSLAPP